MTVEKLLWLTTGALAFEFDQNLHQEEPNIKWNSQRPRGCCLVNTVGFSRPSQRSPKSVHELGGNLRLRVCKTAETEVQRVFKLEAIEVLLAIETIGQAWLTLSETTASTALIWMLLFLF